MLKRFFDFTLALFFIVCLFPLMCSVAVAVRISDGGPWLFTQPRAGQWGKPFTVRKFRTMTDAKDLDGKLLPDTKRITPFGNLLRRYSLDELPQLINVLSGDMSLVGPRPLPLEYLAAYSLEEARRHEVRPGITGWAQVNGRNAISWEEKFKLDVWYVDHHSFLLDIKILFLTAYVVLTRRGISAQGEATMPKFKGTLRK